MTAETRRAPSPTDDELDASSPSELRLDGLRVLLVEDDPDCRIIAELMLETAGAHVVAVESAAAARAVVRYEPFDAMICDIGMPGENGYQLAESVRALPAFENGEIPLIALTAFALPADVARAEKAGYDAHIAKPFDRKTLVSTVSKMARPA